MTHRIDAAAGLVAAPLVLAGFALAGPAPAPSSDAADIARHLLDHRTRILTGDFLIAIGAAFYVWFLAALRTHLSPDPTLSTASFAGGVVGTGLVLVGTALQMGLVFSQTTLANADVARAGFDAYSVMWTMGGVGFALTVAAAAGAARRTGRLGPRLRASGWLVAALQLATLPGLAADDGPFAAAAPVPVLAFWALTVWSVAVAVTLMRR
jgi:hypothetical protein